MTVKACSYQVASMGVYCATGDATCALMTWAGLQQLLSTDEPVSSNVSGGEHSISRIASLDEALGDGGADLRMLVMALQACKGAMDQLSPARIKGSRIHVHCILPPAGTARGERFDRSSYEEWLQQHNRVFSGAHFVYLEAENIGRGHQHVLSSLQSLQQGVCDYLVLEAVDCLSAPDVMVEQVARGVPAYHQGSEAAACVVLQRSAKPRGLARLHCIPTTVSAPACVQVFEQERECTEQYDVSTLLGDVGAASSVLALVLACERLQVGLLPQVETRILGPDQTLILQQADADVVYKKEALTDVENS